MGAAGRREEALVVARSQATAARRGRPAGRVRRVDRRALTMPAYPSGLRFERIVVPTPFAVGPANVYVTTAPPFTLIDTGTNTPETEVALLAGLSDAGVSPERIERIVITHGHPDHYGLAPMIRERSGAKVLVGEA